MNKELINVKDEIISVICAGCHQQTIYLKIMNASENTQLYRPQRIICSQCQLTHHNHKQTGKFPPLGETA